MSIGKFDTLLIFLFDILQISSFFSFFLCSNLKEFSIEEILDSFDKHKEKLKGLFNELKYERSAKALRAEDMIFTDIIEEILTGEQQLAMIDALTENLTKSKDFNEVSFFYLCN